MLWCFEWKMPSLSSNREVTLQYKSCPLQQKWFKWFAQGHASGTQWASQGDVTGACRQQRSTPDLLGGSPLLPVLALCSDYFKPLLLRVWVRAVKLDTASDLHWPLWSAGQSDDSVMERDEMFHIALFVLWSRHAPPVAVSIQCPLPHSVMSLPLTMTSDIIFYLKGIVHIQFYFIWVFIWSEMQ